MYSPMSWHKDFYLGDHVYKNGEKYNVAYDQWIENSGYFLLKITTLYNTFTIPEIVGYEAAVECLESNLKIKEKLDEHV